MGNNNWTETDEFPMWNWSLKATSQATDFLQLALEGEFPHAHLGVRLGKSIHIWQPPPKWWVSLPPAYRNATEIARA